MTVILFPKPGEDPRQAGNILPISLLSQSSKLFERLVQRSERDHLHSLDVLISEQFGFREGYSSTHQLMRVVETITGAGCSVKQTFGFFLDVEHPFDRVWLEGLIHKLREILLSDFYVHLTSSFLRSRTFSARVDGYFSTERTMRES